MKKTIVDTEEPLVTRVRNKTAGVLGKKEKDLLIEFKERNKAQAVLLKQSQEKIKFLAKACICKLIIIMYYYYVL